MKKWVSLAAMLGIMALIFFLSAQPGESSGALSESVADSMQHSGAADLLLPAWFSANVYANVRKWAHVYIYAALGAAAGGATAFSVGIAGFQKVMALYERLRTEVTRIG